MALTNLRESDSGTYVCYSSDQAKIEFGAVNLQVLGELVFKHSDNCNPPSTMKLFLSS